MLLISFPTSHSLSRIRRFAQYSFSYNLLLLQLANCATLLSIKPCAKPRPMTDYIDHLHNAMLYCLVKSNIPSCTTVFVTAPIFFSSLPDASVKQTHAAVARQDVLIKVVIPNFVSVMRYQCRL